MVWKSFSEEVPFEKAVYQGQGKNIDESCEEGEREVVFYGKARGRNKIGLFDKELTDGVRCSE